MSPRWPVTTAWIRCWVRGSYFHRPELRNCPYSQSMSLSIIGLNLQFLSSSNRRLPHRVDCQGSAGYPGQCQGLFSLPAWRIQLISIFLPLMKFIYQHQIVRISNLNSPCC
jgi:hypothetical protein